jgi:tetratricopeptide (TPR) repeat protein
MSRWVAALFGRDRPQPTTISAAPEVPGPCDQGMDAYDAGRFDEAIESFSRCLERADPLARERAQLLALRGMARLDNGSTTDAVADFAEAMRVDRTEPASYYGRSQAYQQLGEHERALADLNEVLQLEPQSPVAYANRAVVYNYLQRSEEAFADAEMSIRLDPENAAPYCTRGRILAEQGNFDDALSDFNTCIRLDPEAPLGYAGRGHVYFELGRFKRARSDLDMAIELGHSTGQLYYERAVSLANLGRYGEAIASSSRAIELDPEQPEHFGHLAWMLATLRAAALRDGPLAVSLAEKAVALAPENPWMLNALAAAYAEVGRFDDAVRTQQAVIEIMRQQDVLVLGAEDRLAHYQRHKPWRG